ncbi:hypothetical protein F6V25_15315 [Oryzomonas japonica]|uniref:Lipoprotein n=1 Tax=Oryzomonas japonica TaxID=2603858 RepID=A0A7J4ZMN6_9BACT|nr:hypothetical protein [Oryzomonas japonica]KAB0663799.1 hypothetical protein F6V25_15315 [Oryzomonas japonica]
MKNVLSMTVVASFAVFMLAACMLSPGPGGYGVAVTPLVPPLPAIVELDAEPYYYQSGYHYFYQNNRWQYATSRNGPWTELPRSHWPREIRYRGRGEQGGEFRHDHEGR